MATRGVTWHALYDHEGMMNMWERELYPFVERFYTIGQGPFPGVSLKWLLNSAPS